MAREPRPHRAHGAVKKKKRSTKVPGQWLCSRPKVKPSLHYSQQVQEMGVQEKKKLRVTVMFDHVEIVQRGLL